ncbi:MAG TPA: 2'-5' RNA ligase family protein [Gemmatimonadaceae bacterium]|nr:2'-5' RNA ligase family protein [Gemmatimonadaceae bacterium]
MTELRGALAERVRAIQARVDPRMLRELPPHITIAGSSGMGPIAPDTSDEAVAEALARVARDTPPFDVRVQRPKQFMQSNVVVMEIDPNGPIRALHERIKLSGLSYEQPRFTFTPHLTLSFYPELSRDRVRGLLRERIDEPIRIDAIQAYRAVDLTRTKKIFDMPLTGVPT